MFSDHYSDDLAAGTIIYPHPILASDDDAEFIRIIISRLSGLVKDFFEEVKFVEEVSREIQAKTDQKRRSKGYLGERLGNGGEAVGTNFAQQEQDLIPDNEERELRVSFEIHREKAENLFVEIKRSTQLLASLPQGSFRNSINHLENIELRENIAKMAYQWSGEVIKVGEKTMNWFKTSTKMVDDIERGLATSYIRFPWQRRLQRHIATPTSLVVLILQPIAFISLIVTVVSATTFVVAGVSQEITDLVVGISGAIAIVTGTVLLIGYNVTMLALKSLYESVFISKFCGIEAKAAAAVQSLALKSNKNSNSRRPSGGTALNRDGVGISSRSNFLSSYAGNLDPSRGLEGLVEGGNAMMGIDKNLILAQQLQQQAALLQTFVDNGNPNALALLLQNQQQQQQLLVAASQSLLINKKQGGGLGGNGLLLNTMSANNGNNNNTNPARIIASTVSSSAVGGVAQGAFAQSCYPVGFGNSRALLDARFVDAQLVMVGFGFDFNITMWNAAAEGATGFIAYETVGKPLSDLIEGTDAEIREMLSQASKYYTEGVVGGVGPHNPDDHTTQHTHSGGDDENDGMDYADSNGTIRILLKAFATSSIPMYAIVAPVFSEDSLCTAAANSYEGLVGGAEMEAGGTTNKATNRNHDTSNISNNNSNTQGGAALLLPVVVGHVLICAAGRDNLKDAKQYINNCWRFQLAHMLQSLLSEGTFSPEDRTALVAVSDFVKKGTVAALDTLAQSMVYYWEWTTVQQLLSRGLARHMDRCSLERHRDRLFPSSICISDAVCSVIDAVVGLVTPFCKCQIEPDVIYEHKSKVSVFVVCVRLIESEEDRDLGGNKHPSTPVPGGVVHKLTRENRQQIHRSPPPAPRVRANAGSSSSEHGHEGDAEHSVVVTSTDQPRHVQQQQQQQQNKIRSLSFAEKKASASSLHDFPLPPLPRSTPTRSSSSGSSSMRRGQHAAGTAFSHQDNSSQQQQQQQQPATYATEDSEDSGEANKRKGQDTQLVKGARGTVPSVTSGDSAITSDSQLRNMEQWSVPDYGDSANSNADKAPRPDEFELRKDVSKQQHATFVPSDHNPREGEKERGEKRHFVSIGDADTSRANHIRVNTPSRNSFSSPSSPHIGDNPLQRVETEYYHDVGPLDRNAEVVEDGPLPTVMVGAELRTTRERAGITTTSSSSKSSPSSGSPSTPSHAHPAGQQGHHAFDTNAILNPEGDIMRLLSIAMGVIKFSDNNTVAQIHVPCQTAQSQLLHSGGEGEEEEENAAAMAAADYQQSDLYDEKLRNEKLMMHNYTMGDENLAISTVFGKGAAGAAAVGAGGDQQQQIGGVFAADGSPALAMGASTINVLTLIGNLVDQHNVSMALLKTMAVSLTNVHGPADLIKRLRANPCDVDVIVTDKTHYAQVKQILDAYHASKLGSTATASATISNNNINNNLSEYTPTIFLVPLIEIGAVADISMPYVFRTPVNKRDIDLTLSDISRQVNTRKHLQELKEEQERILASRQDSPWTKGRLLGRGAFGAVYEATSDLTGGKMAVKMFYFKPNDVNAENTINTMLREIKIMCDLNHPNIVHYFYCERHESSSLNLFMELCDGSIADLIIGGGGGGPKKGPLRIEDAKTPEEKRIAEAIANLTANSIIKQTSKALVYLHDKGITHRDIKPQNILLKGEVVKVTDFGTARQNKNEELTDVQGTFRYMAPEVYRGEPHTNTCDVWSLGCLTAELLGYPLDFMDQRKSHLLGEMTTVVLPEGLRGEERDFVAKCLHINPNQRIQAAMLLMHPFLALDTDAQAFRFGDAQNRPGRHSSAMSAFSISSQSTANHRLPGRRN